MIRLQLIWTLRRPTLRYLTCSGSNQRWQELKSPQTVMVCGSDQGADLTEKNQPYRKRMRHERLHWVVFVLVQRPSGICVLMNTSDNNCAACRTELIKQVRVDVRLSESEALPIIKSCANTSVEVIYAYFAKNVGYYFDYNTLTPSYMLEKAPTATSPLLDPAM